MTKSEKIKNAIFGAIIGDAVGVPFEFRMRGDFEATEMIGEGTHEQPIGTWSDDSSLLLCIIDSINEKGYDPADIKERFKKWMNEAYMTPHGEVFDIGITTQNALYDLPTFDKFSVKANGNGSLMRTLPLAFYKDDYKDLARKTFDVSEITHGHAVAQACCFLYCLIADQMLTKSFNEAYDTALEIFMNMFEHAKESLAYKSITGAMDRILDKSILDKPEDKVLSSGYVVHTLEATLWCMNNSSSYDEAILKAINLGDDTDTTACVVGGLAGLAWGINEEWKSKLVKPELLDELINNFIRGLE